VLLSRLTLGQKGKSNVKLYIFKRFGWLCCFLEPITGMISFLTRRLPFKETLPHNIWANSFILLRLRLSLCSSPNFLELHIVGIEQFLHLLQQLCLANCLNHHQLRLHLIHSTPKSFQLLCNQSLVCHACRPCSHKRDKISGL